MVSVFHSTCLMFGGSFEPAYFLTVTAIEQHCQTATNKRNAALMQSFLSDILKVPLHRGLVRFNPIPEDCLATGGRTVAAEVEQADAENGVKKTPTAHKRKSMRMQSVSNGKPEEKPAKERRKSLMSLGRRKDSVDRPEIPKDKKASRMSLGPPSRPRNDDDPRKTSADIGPTDLSPTVNGLSQHQVTSQANTSKRIEPSQSNPPTSSASPKAFLNHSRPTSSHKSPRGETSVPVENPPPLNIAALVPPPIPDDAPTPKMTRRKSLMNLFKRDSAKA